MDLSSAFRSTAGRLSVAAAFVVAGCAAGPDYRSPPAPPVARYTPEPLAAATAASDINGGSAQNFRLGADVPAQWWKLFGSASLDAVVAAALDANPNLQAAEAALRVAQENVRAQQGAGWPSLQAGITSSRQRIAGIVASPLNSNDALIDVHTTQLTVGFMPDVFGGNARQVESLAAQAAMQRFQRDAVYLALTANVVLAAIQEAALRAQITATGEAIRIAEEQVGIARRQLELGAIAEIGVLAQETVLAQARAALPILQKQLALQRGVLAALCGRLPGEEFTERFDLADLHLPTELPLSVPSRLVEQRPDVRAADAQMHAASAQVGVADANLLPQFNLTGSTGNVATVLARLLSPGGAFWNLAAGLTQPIFEGGALRAKKRAAVAAYDQAAAQYRSTLVTAFQDVANALAAINADAEALRVSVDAERAATASLTAVRRQRELGDVSYLALLAGEQAYQQTVINRVQAQANRLADTAVLFQALGSGSDYAATPSP